MIRIFQVPRYRSVIKKMDRIEVASSISGEHFHTKDSRLLKIKYAANAPACKALSHFVPFEKNTLKN